MTSEHFAPLPPSDFSRDHLKQWFQQQTLSAQKLITGSIQADQEVSSANYVAGTSGWQIDGDGNAEFNNVTVRGTIIASVLQTDVDGNDRLVIDGSANESFIKFYDGNIQFGEIGYIPNEFGQETIVINNDSGTGGITLSADGLISLQTSATTTEVVEARYTGFSSSKFHFQVISENFSGVILRVRESSGNPQILIRDGQAALPGLAFLDDSDTGVYLAGANALGFATGGSQRLEIAGTRIDVRSGVQFLADFGGGSAPGLGFSGDADTGFRRASTNQVRIVGGGVDQISIGDHGGTDQIRSDTIANDTTGGASPVHIVSGSGRIQRSTSALKYKEHVTYDVDHLANIPLKPSRHYRPDDERWRYSLVADDLADADPLLGVYDEAGEIENYDIPAVLAIFAAKLNRLESLQ